MEFEDIINFVKKENPSDTVMLSFSGGKNAWGIWCAIKDYFDIQPFYYQAGVPGLEFVENYLEYAEKKIGKRIIRLPSPSLYLKMQPDTVVDQTPHRVLALQVAQLQLFNYADCQEYAAESAGLPLDTYTAVGLRAADSQRRALHFKKHGAITISQHKFYPIWDWKKDRLIDALKRNAIKLPVDYRMFGRSFDGTYMLFIEPIKKYFPRDYQKILEWFPHLETEFYRYEKRKARGF